MALSPQNTDWDKRKLPGCSGHAPVHISHCYSRPRQSGIRLAFSILAKYGHTHDTCMWSDQSTGCARNQWNQYAYASMRFSMHNTSRTGRHMHTDDDYETRYAQCISSCSGCTQYVLAQCAMYLRMPYLLYMPYLRSLSPTISRHLW